MIILHEGRLILPFCDNHIRGDFMKDKRLPAHRYLKRNEMVELSKIKGTNLYGMYDLEE
jgi:hypothetical protein